MIPEAGPVGLLPLTLDNTCVGTYNSLTACAEIRQHRTTVVCVSGSCGRPIVLVYLDMTNQIVAKFLRAVAMGC